MKSFLQDLRYEARALVRNRGLTMATMLCLAFGIGANVMMFEVIDTLLFRAPARVEAADQVVRLYSIRTFPSVGEVISDKLSHPAYRDLSQVSSFSSVAACYNTRVAIGRGGEAARVRAGVVTHSFLPLLGVRPARGRFFTEQESSVSEATPVAVISDGFWRRRFRGDPEVIGQELLLGRNRVEVIGVTPPGFRGIELEATDIWLPIGALGVLTNPDWHRHRYSAVLDVIARLAAGATPAQARQQATSLAQQANPPGLEERIALAPLLRAQGPQSSADVEVPTWLAGVSVIVLLIAGANVSNLLLVWALGRRREMAVRMALGAGRAQIWRHMLLAGLLRAALGGGAALLVVIWAGGVSRGFLLPETLEWTDLLGPRTLLFTALLTLVAGVVCALPALRVLRPKLGLELTSGGHTEGVGQTRLRGALVVGQVAFTFVLLVGVGLFGRSLQNVRAIDLGFDVERVVAIKVDLRHAGLSANDRQELYRRLLERFSAMPGVTRASLAAGVPFEWSFAGSVAVPGIEELPQTPYMYAVARDFFATVGLELRRGSGFGETAGNGSAPQFAVVNETMARLVWPDEDPVGKCIKVGDDGTVACTTVAGVVEDAPRHQLFEDPSMQFYVPLEQSGMSAQALLLRARTAPEELMRTVRRELDAFRPELPYVQVRRLLDVIARQLRPWRLGTTMFGLFGGLAFVLTILGIYGVITYTVARRTHDLGIRIALGAGRRQIVGLVLRQALGMVVGGVVIGVVAAVAAGRLVASSLVGVTPWDPWVLCLAAAALVATAISASYLPARRASRIEPAVALRIE